jgi:YidC/Oxa1 family membrane protein insertase
VQILDVFRDLLYTVLKSFQHITDPLLGGQSYWFSIVLLTIMVRILLIPLTVKQVRSTRVMQELQPELKKLQAKYKNDKPKLQEELMKLYRERGFNPMAGCWPLAAQLPFFWALYRVIYSRNISGEPNILLGKTFFGVPLEQRWSMLHGWGDKLGSAAGLTILGLIIAMAVTTYVSQRQLMARQSADSNPQQQMLLKIMPLMFVVFAINVPLAVVVYWVTTNLWSMGQQWVLLRNYQPPTAATATAGAANASGAKSGGDGQPRKGLGALGVFRSLTQSQPQPRPANPPSKQRQGTTKNGSGSGNAASGKGKNASPRGQQAGDATKEGGEGRSRQAGRPGTGGGRKPGSGGGGRSTGKGKPGGQQRRSKR